MSTRAARSVPRLPVSATPAKTNQRVPLPSVPASPLSSTLTVSRSDSGKMAPVSVAFERTSQARIKHVAQAVADDVQAPDQQRDTGPGEYPQPPAVAGDDHLPTL